MTRRKLVKFLGTFLFLTCVFYLFTEPFYTPTAIPVDRKLAIFPRIIAHKSIVSGDFKGNTQEAIQEALGSYVDGIELDVRFSKDHVPFLFHGETLDESTDGKGLPEDHLWEELQKLSYTDDRLSHRYDRNQEDEEFVRKSKILSLDEALDLIGSQKFIFLDIKTQSILNNTFAREISQRIQSRHLESTVFVESFNPLFMIAMRLTSRDILLMYDFVDDAKAIGEEKQSQFDHIPWLLKKSFVQKQIRRLVRPDVLGMRFNFDMSERVSLINHGYPVITWTVDDPNVAQSLFDEGVVGVQTNKPLILLDQATSNKTTIFDAGGSSSRGNQVIHVKKMSDIGDAIKQAKSQNKKIIVSGRRHSMGGQSLCDQAIHLDMLGFDGVYYNAESKTVTVEAGATWKKVQDILNEHNRSVKVMQSDNIFSIGGSVSVNVHGWQVSEPPIASTIRSMRVILPNGELKTLTPTKDVDVFKLVVGGYGLFGIIVDVEFETVQNDSVEFHALFLKPDQFLQAFDKHITRNNKAELAYARLSVDQNHLFDEIGLFWYEKSSKLLSQNGIRYKDGENSPVTSESFVALKRSIFRFSEYFNWGKKLRWKTEKAYAIKMTKNGPLSRNNAMNTDIHILWPLYGKNKDILHEYFVLKQKLPQFLSLMKKHILEFDMNILNVTVREVRKDTLTFMPYASDDMFGLVCLFSQKQTSEDEEKMKKFSQKLIDASLNLSGTFYLPYRLHYTQKQLVQAYPMVHAWLNLKKKCDPDGLLRSAFFDYIEGLVESVNQRVQNKKTFKDSD